VKQTHNNDANVLANPYVFANDTLDQTGGSELRIIEGMRRTIAGVWWWWWQMTCGVVGHSLSQDRGNVGPTLPFRFNEASVGGRGNRSTA
jgi:hypothetical protein